MTRIEKLHQALSEIGDLLGPAATSAEEREQITEIKARLVKMGLGYDPEPHWDE